MNETINAMLKQANDAEAGAYSVFWTSSEEHLRAIRYQLEASNILMRALVEAIMSGKENAQ